MLYINEANNVSFEAYQELSVRTKQDVYLDWNPTKEFWFHEHIKEDDDVDFIILTYLDNEACPQSAIDYILKAKEKAKDSKYWANWYRVYGLGLVGNLEGTVFENWEEGEFNQSLVSTYGMDFGFSPDPTTLVKTAIDTKQKIIYVKELFYAHKLGTKDIIDLCNSNVPKNESIVCDSAESREINEMRRANINALKCKKGKDSVRTGIKNMMDYKIIVTPESINIKKELRNYVWNDKQAGIPLKGNDHCFVGDTMVITDKGSKRIDCIKVGDMVANSVGFNEVIKVWDNGVKNTFEYLMQFDTFNVSLRCTPNHLIKTSIGWIEIQNLTNQHEIFLNKALTEKITTYTKEKGIFQKVIKDYIGRFGSFIMEKFLKVTTSIMLTELLRITGLKTLISLVNLYIKGIMEKRGLKKIKNGLKTFILKGLKKLKNGINQKKVSNGTKNKELKHGLIESIKPLYVKNVVMNTKLDTLVYQNTAIITARLVQIEEKEKKELQVYDLMVKDNHEYTANGVVVHNCIDPIRYCFEFLLRMSR